MLWKVVANKLCVVACKQNGMDDINVFENWMMSLNVHIKSQKWKVFWNMDNSATYSLKHVGRGESFGFTTLQLSNIIIVVVPPNVTSVVQPLDWGIITSVKSSI